MWTGATQTPIFCILNNKSKTSPRKWHTLPRRIIFSSSGVIRLSGLPVIGHNPPPPLPSVLFVLLLLEGHLPRRGHQRGHQRGHHRMELIISDLRHIDIFQVDSLDQRYLILVAFVIVWRHKVRGGWYWQIIHSSGCGLRGSDGIRVSGGGVILAPPSRISSVPVIFISFTVVNI